MLRGARLGDRRGGRLDVLGGVVGAAAAATQDDVHVLVAARLDDRGEALLGHAHERVRVRGGAHRVDRDADLDGAGEHAAAGGWESITHAAVGAVLEADREGDAARQLTVELRLRGACADGAPRGEVGDVLGRDGVEELRADGDAEVRQVAQELAGDADALVDLEGAVDIGVVDQTLPADSRAGFLCSRSGQCLLPLHRFGDRRLTSL